LLSTDVQCCIQGCRWHVGRIDSCDDEFVDVKLILFLFFFFFLLTGLNLCELALNEIVQYRSDPCTALISDNIHKSRTRNRPSRETSPVTITPVVTSTLRNTISRNNRNSNTSGQHCTRAIDLIAKQRCTFWMIWFVNGFPTSLYNCAHPHTVQRTDRI
jgi:hypothetical protein